MIRLLAISTLVVAAVACDDTRSRGHVTGKDVRDAYGDAASTTKAYVSQTRDEYVAKAQREMDDADAELARLRSEAKGAAADTKVRIDASIASLEARRAQAAARLNDLKNATGDAWRDMTAGVDRALAELQSSAKSAKERFGR
jgi:hypothetical protein